MNSSNSKVIIFDFDGTLANSQDVIFETINALSGKYNYEKIKRSELDDLQNKSIYELMKKFNISFLRLSAIVRDYRHTVKTKVDQIKPFENIIEVLVTLKKEGFALSILTSNSKENVLKFLKNNKIYLFDFVFSEKNIFGKDKSLNKIIKQHDFKKENSIYVGDEVRDIEAAKMAGLKSIAVSWGFNSRTALEIKKPDRLIQNPKDLVPAINELLA